MTSTYPGGGFRTTRSAARGAAPTGTGGNRLIIPLTKRDGAFLSKITMPFFQATSTKLPLSREVMRPYPSAGPYAFTRNDVNSRMSIRRNPYWLRGPGRQRPRNLVGLDVLWGLDEETAFQQV